MAFADTMVAKLETLLTENVGVKSVNVDGTTIAYADLEKQYDYWKARAARASGARPRSAQIKLAQP